MLKPLPPHTARLLGRRPATFWNDADYVATARHTRMAYRALGPQSGEPWLVLHGGPGSGSQPGLLQAFELDRHRVVVPDQRGSGLSRPRGRTMGNNTDQLVADLECLRQQLNIERWNVLAGSWGTVLALRYAQQYPQRVARLVLRGAFRVSWAEFGGILKAHSHKGRAMPPPTYCRPYRPGGLRSSGARSFAKLEQVLQGGTPVVATLHAIRWWNLWELSAVLHGVKRSLIHANSSADQSLAPAIRRDWAHHKRQQGRAEARFRSAGISHADRRGWQKFRIQAHYLRHFCFLRPGDLDHAVSVVLNQGIPIDWVHGQFDAVCPPANSRRWLAQGQEKHAGLASGHWPIGGHLAGEPGLCMALTKAIQNPSGVR